MTCALAKDCLSKNLSNGKIVAKNNDKGMMYLDLRDPDTTINLGIDNTHNIIQGLDDMAVALVQMVRSNMEGFTKRKVKDTCAACEAQAMLNHLTDGVLLGMVHHNMISSCPLTQSAVIYAHTIFGPDLAGVRGRTVRRPPDTVTTMSRYPEPSLKALRLSWW
jgi:hypothetical protein